MYGKSFPKVIERRHCFYVNCQEWFISVNPIYYSKQHNIDFVSF